MITAVIASSSSSCPACGDAESVRPATRMPAIPASSPHERVDRDQHAGRPGCRRGARPRGCRRRRRSSVPTGVRPSSVAERQRRARRRAAPARGCRPTVSLTERADDRRQARSRVCPSESTSASPRTMPSVPSVTMNGFSDAPVDEHRAVGEPDGERRWRRTRARRARAARRRRDDGDDAGEPDDRADREVDAARDDDEQLPEREHGDERRLEAEVGEVAAGEEVRREQRHRDDEHDEDQQRPALQRAQRPAPTRGRRRVRAGLAEPPCARRSRRALDQRCSGSAARQQQPAVDDERAAGHVRGRRARRGARSSRRPRRARPAARAGSAAARRCAGRRRPCRSSASRCGPGRRR